MENTYYTQEQLKTLKDIGAVQHFNTVLDSDYMRSASLDMCTVVADIYDEVTGGKVSRNFGCKSCVYNLYRDAGRIYRNTLAHIQSENLKKAREAKKQNKEVKNKEKDGSK